jgi:phage FluMu protein Com
MNITVKCVKCNELYKINMFSARLHGPVIHLICPRCKHVYKRNLAVLLEKEVMKRQVKAGDFKGVRSMQRLAVKLENSIIHGEER